MKYSGEEMFRDFTLNGYWWLPSDPSLNRRMTALLMLLIFKYLGLPEDFVFVPIVGHLRLF